MDPKFQKPYDPQETEGRIYKTWEESGLFNPDTMVEAGLTKANAKPFTIMMPPPNVTGVLHMGHALMLTIEDIMIRYKRMQGFKTLWLPGTDHAAIATQARVEKDIYKKEGKSRHDLGREEFLKRVEQFAQDSHDTIVSQVKTMGASCDWSREAYTLDETRNHAVNTMFKMMHDAGLIYQGHRIVNWDPKGQTTISDDEIVYQEEKTTFYTFKYGPFEIATARPETKFGDKYVVMHPNDARYAKYKRGDTFELEWINGPITATVIKDAAIDMEFGTGVMTITPWHSVVDFEMAERHGLNKEQVIDKYGKLLPIAGEFAGKKISEARALIVEKMRSKGLVVKEEPYTHNIATAERTGGIIEPQIMNQWFVAVNKPFILPHSEINGIKSGSETTLKEIMKAAVRGGQMTIMPDNFEKVYFNWVDNLRDWCISRQIWYGHRIPVWTKNTEITVGTAPTGEGWTQDEDTLDTWFSSGIWTFSTLGWPEKTKDLETYHPTDVLETGYEILFFWIARMVLMTGFALGQVPFHTVYLHGTVRDAKGQKMSKSLGNGIDPMDVAAKFGADAGRMALIIGNTPGTDTRISEDKIKGYKHFANKLWNITRFALENTEDYKPEEMQAPLTESDKKRLEELYAVVQDATKDLDEYRFYLAAEKLYHYAWHTLADAVIEEMKPRLKNTEDPEDRKSAQWTLLELLRTTITALHPFMPFITEEIWSSLPNRDATMLMSSPWPRL